MEFLCHSDRIPLPFIAEFPSLLRHFKAECSVTQPASLGPNKSWHAVRLPDISIFGAVLSPEPCRVGRVGEPCPEQATIARPPDCQIQRLIQWRTQEKQSKN